MDYKIYKITNTVNGKVYIGQTMQKLGDRWRDHSKPSSSACFLLKRSIRKYGKQKFTIEQIDFTNTQQDIDKKEKEWIAHYRSNDPKYGYNYLDGGRGFTGIHSEETKNKLSIAARGSKNFNFGKPKSQEFKDYMSKTMTGTKKSIETKKKISDAMMGDKNPNWAKTRSKEWKENCSSKQKARIGNVGSAIKRPVLELTTGLFFDSIADAGEAFGINEQRVRRQLLGCQSKCHNKKFAFVE